MNIIDVCCKMQELGWVAATDGNVSVRTDCGCLITPSCVRKGDVTSGMLVEVDGNGAVVNPSQYKPSSEAKMHLRCYSERGDIGAVIHAHPPCATAFAIAGRGLDDDSLMEAVLTIGRVPLAPYATPSTEEVGDSVSPLLQGHSVILLQNHGALAAGADLLTAFNRMETLEHWAKTVLNAQLLGGTKAISRENIDRLAGLRERYGIV